MKVECRYNAETWVSRGAPGQLVEDVDRLIIIVDGAQYELRKTSGVGGGLTLRLDQPISGRLAIVPVAGNVLQIDPNK